LHEVNEAATLIQEEADEEANIIFGAVIDENMGEDISITVIATGFGDTESLQQPKDGHKPALSTVRGGLRTTAVPRKVVHLGTVVDDDLDTPTWQRKKQGESASETTSVAEREDKFDIPAFLRKQAN
jgi:cell division protein FtsZ